MSSTDPDGLNPKPPGVSVSQVASRLRVYEDETLAHRLQDEEFGTHYELNRSERRQVGGDVRKSRVEQELEDRFAAEYRAQRRRDSEQRDAEIARRLQEELEMEERRVKEEQTRIDEELARRLQSTGQVLARPPDPVMVAEDEALAARLQEAYNRRAAQGQADENVENQLNDFRVSRDRMHSLPVRLPTATPPPRPPPPVKFPSTGLPRTNVIPPDPTHAVADLISFDEIQLHPTNPFVADIIASASSRIAHGADAPTAAGQHSSTS